MVVLKRKKSCTALKLRVFVLQSSSTAHLKAKHSYFLIIIKLKQKTSKWAQKWAKWAADVHFSYKNHICQYCRKWSFFRKNWNFIKIHQGLASWVSDVQIHLLYQKTSIFSTETEFFAFTTLRSIHKKLQLTWIKQFRH